MKQAIQEGFILDVLKNYTTIDSWYKIAKKVEDDPMFDKKRAQKNCVPLSREIRMSSPRRLP